MSLSPHVPLTSRPSHLMSLLPHVPLTSYPSHFMSLSPHVPLTSCPSHLMSLSPHVPLTAYRSRRHRRLEYADTRGRRMRKPRPSPTHPQEDPRVAPVHLHRLHAGITAISLVPHPTSSPPTHYHYRSAENAVHSQYL